MLDTTTLSVTGQIWHMDPSNVFEALLDGEDGRVVIERCDHDEVAIHFMLGDDAQAVASIYVNRLGAFALAGLLHAAASGEFSVAPVAVAARQTGDPS